ncbi:Peptide deformylase [Variovorax sp. PBS-H4]|uniref:peptide deformylase n=1 Tax=Variovorax sp. PBS-H4 TaxID=434008 RepID=UPI001315C4D2|nr:peptide deformylase [Variovorax sp. PBS-H4]VTU37546.1 Peptide deformylase [Variovorax sp. PBS-H4]
MAIRPILKMGNPELLVTSRPVEDPKAPEVRALFQDMLDTLESVKGIGIAAPQLGEPLRMVLYCIPASRIPEGSTLAPVPWTAMINPVIEPVGTEEAYLWERCLSLPGLYAKVPRFKHIRIHFQTPEGEQVSRDCSGYHSTLLQHECDHLEGRLYPSRITNPTDFAFVSEVCGEGGVYKYSVEEFDGH